MQQFYNTNFLFEEMNKEITLEKNQNFHNNQTKERQIQNNPEKHLQPTKHQEYAEPSLRGSNVRSIYSTNNSPQSLINFFKSYNANQEVLNLPKLHSSPNLKLKRYKQSVYYGQFINMKRHGIGIMVYNNQRSYEGDWQCDYKHGKGFQKFPNGCTYQGYYINGKPQGMGRYSWPNGQFYQGQWLNGMKHGSGMWKGAKGDSYVGQWKFGKADGYGAHTWINGDRYQGEFKECLKHGQGLQKFANGDIYKGTYSYGKPSGYGEYYWINGSYFKGVFKNGLRDGQGIWKKGSGNSDKYEGQYLNDKKNGYGIFTWSSGNVYKGNYQADIRNSYGQMYWNDGSFYKGQWKNGIQHGYGQIYVPGQGLKKGVFEENVLIHIEEQTSNYINDGNHFKGRQNVNVSNHQTKIPSKKTSISGKSVQSKIHSNNLNGHQKPTFRSRSRVQSNHKPNNKSVDEAKIIRLSSNYETVNNADLGNKFKRMRIGQSSFDHQSRTINGDELSQNFTRQKILHSASYMHNMLLNNTHAVKLYQKRPANISNLKNQFKRPNQLNNLILYKNQGRKH